MSVTLFPLAGQWTTYSYYEDDGDAGHSDGVQNGFMRFAHEEPEMQLANGNFFCFAKAIGIERYCNDGQCGTIPIADHDVLEAACYAISRNDQQDEQLRDYARRFLHILHHSKYHGCDISFG
jgi:hypothetical protein